MPTTSTASKIRNLLAKGVEPLAIAKRLDVKVAKVYTTRWLMQNKNKVTKARRTKNKAKSNGHAVPELVLTPPPSALNLRDLIHAELRSQVAAEVAKVLAGG